MKIRSIVALCCFAFSSGCAFHKTTPSKSFDFSSWDESQNPSFKIRIENVKKSSNHDGYDFSINRFELDTGETISIYSGFNPSWKDEHPGARKLNSVWRGRPLEWRLSDQAPGVLAESLIESADGDLFWHIMINAHSIQRAKAIIETLGKSERATIPASSSLHD